MNRRQLLKGGSTLGALLAGGAYGRYRWFPPSASAELLPVDELARRFVASLDEATRAEVCVPYDHPLRQYHNRGVSGGGAPIDAGRFSWAQRGMLNDLFHAGLSPAGRERVPNEYFQRFGGVQQLQVLVCGEPESPPYQVILSGPHLNLRLGGTSKEGVAFGGPQVYGDQRGDGRVGLPGNLYRFQLELGQRLFDGLDEGRRRVALLEHEPIQTAIELQGRGGSFPGLPVVELGEAKALVGELVRAILSTYPPADAAYAEECLAANGGLDALHLSYYADGEVGGSGLYQIFRLEGPAAVFHFRGAPHVHAFVNVAMDGDAPLSVGEPLGENPAPLVGEGVQRLFALALRTQCGTELGYYDADGVSGSLRQGAIRTGDIYTLESWQDRAVVVEVRGRALAPALAAALRAADKTLEPERRYTIATQADGTQAGRLESTRTEAPVRELTIAYLRAHGFAEVHAQRG